MWLTDLLILQYVLNCLMKCTGFIKNFRKAIRRRLLLVIIVGIGFLFPHTSHAQFLHRFGFNVGYISAHTIYHSNAGSLLLRPPGCPSNPIIGTLNYNPSYLLGLVGEINAAQYMHIRTGLSYFKTTKKSEQCSRQQFTNHWLNLDIALKVSPGQVKLNPYFVAGPRFRWLLYDSYNIINRSEITPRNLYERTSLDLLLGIGVDLDKNFTFEIQYISGIASVYRYILPYQERDIYFSNRDRFFTFNLIYYFIKSKNWNWKWIIRFVIKSYQYNKNPSYHSGIYPTVICNWKSSSINAANLVH